MAGWLTVCGAEDTCHAEVDEGLTLTELADAVALLRMPAPRWRTLRVVGREWRHCDLLHDAFMAATPPGALVAKGVRVSGEPAPEQSEETWRLWCEAPERLRADFAVGTEMVTAWFRGGTWWSWSPSQGARTNEGRQNIGHGKGPGEVMVWPGRIAQVLDFELVGKVEVLSRPAYWLRARPFTRHHFDLHSLGRGADEYELVVDAEHGFLLRAQARLGAEPFRALEMTELAVDAGIPADVFTPQAPNGEQFEFFEPWLRLSLAELPGAVPFKVFVPAKAPGWVALVQIKNPEPRRDIPLSATIAYFVPKPGGEQGNLWVTESAEPERPSPRPPLGEVWRDVDVFKVGTDDSMGYLRCKVLLEREGTHIHLESTAMAVQELIGLARSLVLLTAQTPPELGTT
jgi:hypothetical protein